METKAKEMEISQVILECPGGETYIINLPKENNNDIAAGSSAETCSQEELTESLSWKCHQIHEESKRKGWKQGTWSKEEIDLLQLNINTYCTNHSIKDPSTIIFNSSKDVRKDFYRSVAAGIQRPLFSVYRRIIRMYDSKNHVGKYSSDEVKQLQELREQYGNDWQKIGLEMGRSASSIKDRCRLMKDNCNAGVWSSSEEDRLARAVFQLSRVIPGENVPSGVSWTRVSEIVGTRTERQCRKKWMNYSLQCSKGNFDEWSCIDDIHLASKLNEKDVTNEEEIDWVSLAQKWPRASVRSPHWLRCKWWMLKSTIKNHQKLNLKASWKSLYFLQANFHEALFFRTREHDLASSTQKPSKEKHGKAAQSVSYPLITGIPVSLSTDVLPAGTVAVIHGDFDVGDDSAVTTDVMFSGGSCSQGSPLGLVSKSDDESEHSHTSK